MSTRLKRPAVWRPLGVTVLLLAGLGYLGYNCVSGQFGIQSQRQMRADIEQLKAQSAALEVQIQSYRHRESLFASDKLDPDIITERARALLGMAHPDDVVVMTDPRTGLPISGLSMPSTDRKLNTNIPIGID
jgi:cell division protein FtsB